MNIQEKRDNMNAKTVEMRTLLDETDGAGKPLDGEKRSRFDTLHKEAQSLQKQIDDAEKLAQMQRYQENADPVSGNEMRSLTEGFSVAKAVNESLSGRLTGREAEYAQERQRNGEQRSGSGILVAVPTEIILGGETRALTTNTPADGAGGNLVGTQLMQMTDRRRPQLKIETLGATVLRGLTGNVDLPRLKDGGSAGWVNEHEDSTRSDVKFSKTDMSPKTGTAEYELSRRMLLQSNEAIETIMRNDLAYLLSQALDSAAIRGGGTNEPTGILANQDVQSVMGGAFDSDITADLIAALETDNVTGTTGFLTNPTVMNAARKMKAEGRTIPLAELFHNERIESSTQVPSDIGTGGDKNALIYGEWASLYLAYWSGIDLLINPYHADVASKGGVLIHAFLDCDVAVRHPEGFRYAEID